MRAENHVAQTSSGTVQNLVQMLVEQAQRPSRIAATQKRGGRWEEINWGQVLDEVKAVSAGLVAWGIQPGDRVALFANTQLQWVICDLAIAAAQAITVPIYSSNTADETRYILNNSETTLLFVDNDESDGKQVGRLSRVRQKISECPSVRKVVVFDSAAAAKGEGTLEALTEEGRKAHQADPAAFDARVKAVKLEDPACFIYTSGTTGEPKGVVLSHGNWTYEASGIAGIGVMNADDAVMLFLPLAHSFAQVVKASWLGLGFNLIFAESVDKLLANLVDTKPTILPAVPRVFEKVYNGVIANGSAAPGVKGKLFRWAFKLFDEYVEARIQGREFSSLSFALAKKLVFAKVKASLDEKLGGRIRLFASGGAPLSPKIAYFFDLIGFKILEGYGLSETSAGSTINRPHLIKIGTVGAPIPGTEVKIAADGEILMRGPGVMKGYYKNPTATAEAFDAEGWFKTGDIGELDADQFLKITDRKKDIIVTAGGKNVAPQNLENQLKTFPIISQAMVHGDKRKYLTVLITVAEEPARKLVQEAGATVQSYADLAQRPEIQAAVQEAIDKVNADLPPYNSLKRFAILSADFSQETGELTPTLKVKRKLCTQRYGAVLNSLYDGETV